MTYKGRLLSSSTKTKKSDDSGLGYLTKILYLAPYKLSGTNVCPHASSGCAAACLNKAGMGFYPAVQQARLEKTLFFIKRETRMDFLSKLVYEVALFRKLCNKKGMRAAIRLNGTSDLKWEKIIPSLFSEFSDVVFYDYTKNPQRMLDFCHGKFPPNYHLTFSRSESNDQDVKRILEAGGNVSVVFKVDRMHNMPKTFLGKKVLNGDTTDLRFLDKRGIIGLSAKGIGRSDTSGFVVYKKRK